MLDLCDRVTQLWQACPKRPVTLNLPATVAVATPNVYADQIEYMHRNLSRRDGVVLSVHPHNDRGMGVACAELAVLAGAQRVEGCLFGNGRRAAAAAGLAESEAPWNVPHLPVDSADIGRDYDAVIRVNSQSGKGGIAYLLEIEYGITLPRKLQIDFARHVQRHSDTTGIEKPGMPSAAGRPRRLPACWPISALRSKC